MTSQLIYTLSAFDNELPAFDAPILCNTLQNAKDLAENGLLDAIARRNVFRFIQSFRWMPNKAKNNYKLWAACPRQYDAFNEKWDAPYNFPAYQIQIQQITPETPIPNLKARKIAILADQENLQSPIATQ
jgi:hypothetical protein